MEEEKGRERVGEAERREGKQTFIGHNLTSSWASSSVISWLVKRCSL